MTSKSILISRLSHLERNSNLIPFYSNSLLVKALTGEMSREDIKLFKALPRTATRPAVTLADKLKQGSLR